MYPEEIALRFVEHSENLWAGGRQT